MSNPMNAQAIPLSQIRPNPNNPPLNQGEIDLMMASLQELGQETDAKVRLLTEEEKAADPDHLYELIGGHLRFAAAQRLGWPTLSCKVMDKDPVQAAKSAFVDNRTRKRPWLEDDLDIGRIAKLNGSQRKTADELEVSKSRVQIASTVANALTPTSIALIRQNLAKAASSTEGGGQNLTTQNKEFLINEYMVLALADLGDPQAVEKALLVVLDHHLTQPQIQQLVAWVQAGNPAETFNPHTAPKPAPKTKTSKTTAPAVLDSEAEPVAIPAVHQAKAAPVAKPAQSEAMGSAETALYEAVAGISVIAKIRSKIKKGERPNLFERFLLAGHALWCGLVWLVQEGFKVTKFTVKLILKTIKMTWKLLRESLEILGIYKFVRAVVVIGLLIALILYGLYVRVPSTRGLIHAFYSMLVPSHSDTTPAPVASAPTPVPAVVPTAEPTKIVAAQTKPKVKKTLAPANTQAALATKAWVPDEETQTNLEQEFASLPKNSIVEPLSFQPNTGIDGAMAGRRLQDLTDPDKYKLLIGHDAQKVMQVNADSTSLNITYQNGLIGLISGGTSKMDFYWEDVRAIHCCQIESTEKTKGHTLYQCSLVLVDAKQPFVVQCPSATNFGRLVSALVFWMKNYGNNAVAVTGLPYLNYGIVMNNDRVVTQVWAHTPADQAGVKCGDHLWSVNTNPRDQQDQKILLKALQQEGPCVLYTVSPTNWDKGLIAQSMNTTRGFNPSRDKRPLS